MNNNAFSLINSAQNITLLTHENPDGDGISACAALEHVLLKLNKTVETVYPNKTELPPKRQPINHNIGSHKQTPNLLIVLDTANIDRMYYPEEFKDIPLINIDHHMSNNINGTINIVKSESSSACELLYELLQEWTPEHIDTYAAECLLSGILYDTQIFQTQSTYPSTLKNACSLMEKGAKLFDIKQELIATKDPKIINVWGNFLSKITTTPKAAWSSVSQQDLKDLDTTPISFIGFSNFLSQISGVDVTAFIYEQEDKSIKISLRSKIIDVNAIAKQLGGGGHKNASGVKLDGPLDKAVKQLEIILRSL